MTSFGNPFVRFILEHNPDITCPKIMRLVLGILTAIVRFQVDLSLCFGPRIYRNVFF